MSIRLCLLSTVCCGLALGSSPLDILIIAHLVPFVKRFGELFSKNSKSFFSLQDLAAPLDTLIIAHSVLVVKRVFQFFFACLPLRHLGGYPLPLNTDILSQNEPKVNG